MFRAFNVKGCSWDESFAEQGAAITERNNRLIKQALELKLHEGVIDGSDISRRWFPPVKSDVFISHSHKDVDQAIRCAGWLKQVFGLNAFVDSCVWGQADSLLKAIDNEYCLFPGGETYNYQKRNQSTSHVHMMLSVALVTMLDSTECIFFLNTSNSITAQDSITKTQSPWLFFELGLIPLLRRVPPVRLITETALSRKQAELKTTYEVSLNELTGIGRTELNQWKDIHARFPHGDHRLDDLYEIAPFA